MSDRPSDRAMEIERARARLAALGLSVPEECLPGVADNLALLDRYWRVLHSPSAR